MRLTPLDIRKQEFSRGIRGYEAEEVDAFLQMVSNQWEELLDEVRRKSDEVRDLEAKLAHYVKVEEALQEALQTARETSKKSIENAEGKAALLIKQADARAAEIKREAEVELRQMKQEIAQLSSRRSEIVTQLRAFLMSEMEILARFEGDDPLGFLKLIPAEHRPGRQTGAAARQEQQMSTHREDPAAPPSQPDSHPSTGAAATGVGASSTPLAPTSTSAHAGADTSTGDPEARAESGGLPDASFAFDEDDDIPADVTAADHAQFNRPLHSPQQGDEAAPTVPEDARDAEQQRDSAEAGWTTQTFVGGAAAEPHEGGPARAGTDDDDIEKTSSEEIEKIRRILSDLD